MLGEGKKVSRVWERKGRRLGGCRGIRIEYKGRSRERRPGK